MHCVFEEGLDSPLLRGEKLGFVWQIKQNHEQRRCAVFEGQILCAGTKSLFQLRFVIPDKER